MDAMDETIDSQTIPTLEDQQDIEQETGILFKN